MDRVEKQSMYDIVDQVQVIPQFTGTEQPPRRPNFPSSICKVGQQRTKEFEMMRTFVVSKGLWWVSFHKLFEALAMIIFIEFDVHHFKNPFSREIKLSLVLE